MDGPYREPKPLSELIAPDRRRQKAMLLIGGGMIAGAILYEVARSALADRPIASGLPPPVAPATTGAAMPVLRPSGPLTREEVETVVAAHRAALRSACWSAGPGGPASVDVTLNLVVGATGDVVWADTQSSDAAVAECVESQARRWLFPAHGERSTTIQIPIRLRRD